MLTGKAQILFTLISAPLNILWQEQLEAAFPSYVSPAVSKKGKAQSPNTPNNTPAVRSNKNTAFKVLIDQTIGAAFNAVLFISLMGALRGASGQVIFESVHKVRPSTSQLKRWQVFLLELAELVAACSGLLAYDEGRLDSLAPGQHHILHVDPAASTRRVWKCCWSVLFRSHCTPLAQLADIWLVVQVLVGTSSSACLCRECGLHYVDQFIFPQKSRCRGLCIVLGLLTSQKLKEGLQAYPPGFYDGLDATIFNYKLHLRYFERK